MAKIELTESEKRQILRCLEEGKRYNISVKAVDIFGNEMMKTIEVGA
jgi:hypothetical protein